MVNNNVETVTENAGSIRLTADYARIETRMLASLLTGELAGLGPDKGFGFFYGGNPSREIHKSQLRLARTRERLLRSMRILKATIAQQKSEQLPAAHFDGAKFFVFDSASKDWLNLGKVTDVKFSYSDNAVRQYSAR